MKKITKFVACALLLTCSCAVLAAPTSGALYDGVWEGEMKRRAPAIGREDWKVRLHFRQESVSVYVQEVNGQWSEVKPGLFKAARNGFNMLVYAMESAVGDCWDETMVYSIAPTLENRLQVEWSRAVNNLRCLSTVSGAASHTHAALGTLHKLSAQVDAPAQSADRP